MNEKTKQIFYRIYTGDYTSIGYRDGNNDAKQGKPKTFWGLIKHRHFLNNFIHFNKSIKTYSNSYNNGYDDHLSAQHNIIQSVQLTPSKTIGINMSTPKNYREISGDLETAKNGIIINIAQLDYELLNYSKKIKDMENVGFLSDYTDRLSVYNGLKVRIDSLKDYLNQIVRKIEDIKEANEGLEDDSKKQ